MVADKIPAKNQVWQSPCGSIVGYLEYAGPRKIRMVVKDEWSAEFNARMRIKCGWDRTQDFRKFMVYVGEL